MKLLKNGIALILVATLMLSFCLPFTVLAAKDEPFDQSMAIINSLKINNPVKATTVTRGEFVYLLMQAMGINTNSAISSADFSDVSTDNFAASAIHYAIGLGIISAGTTFEPNTPLTYEQACKMLVVATGYAYTATSMGGYPVGYLSAATNLGITKHLELANLPVLSYRDTIVMLTNALTTDIMKPIAYGDTFKYQVTNGESILTNIHKWVKVKGILTANEYTSLYDSNIKANRGYIIIESTPYLYSGTPLRLGSSLTGYYKENDNGIQEAVCLTVTNQEEITILSEDISKYTLGSLTYFDKKNSKEIKLHLQNSIAVIYNGKAIIADSTVFNNLNGNVTLIDNNSDGIYEIAYITDYTYMVVSNVDTMSKKIFDVNSEPLLDVSDPDCEVNLPLGSIEKNSLIAVAKSKDGLLVEIKVCKDTVSGHIESRDSNGDIIISGTTYKVNPYYKRYYGSSLGKAATFILGVNGDIVSSTDILSEMKYGYIIVMGNKQGLGNTAQAKLLDQSGKISVYDFANTVTIDGNRTTAPTIISGVFVRYNLNKEGKLSVLDTPGSNGFINDSLPDNNKLTEYGFISATPNSVTYKATTRTFAPAFSLSGGAPIFVISSNNRLTDAQRYKVVSSTYYNSDTSFNVASLHPFDVDINGVAGALLYNESATTSVALSAPSMIIENITKAISKDNEPIYKISGYQYLTGLYVDCYVQDNNYDLITTNNLNAGDIIRYNATSDGELLNIIVDVNFNLTTNTVTINNGLNNTYDQELNYYYGELYSNKDGYGFLSTAMVNNEFIHDVAIAGMLHLPMNSGRVVSLIINTKNDIKHITLAPTTNDELVAYMTSPTLASKVIIRQRNSDNQLILILKKV